MSTEWKCHLVEEWDFRGPRVLLVRRTLAGTEVVTGFTEWGDPIVTAYTEEGASLMPAGAPRLTGEMLAAIADVVRPGPSTAELARLEEALTLERARVDQVLDRTVSSVWSVAGAVTAQRP